MNFSPRTKSWIVLISIALGTGCAIGGGAYAGGAKPGYCIVLGVGAAASAVGHAVMSSPNDKSALPG